MSQILQNPFQTISQLVQHNQVNQLFAYIIQLAQQQKSYISANFEAVKVKFSQDQKTITVLAYLPNYIITIIVNQQNQVTVDIQPAISVNCGGKQ